ncbi:bifunctional metallophosphatase/5'-nucleotidase [Noviherbaspirillum sedimenti]|nr:5'-nucleotidase C-terminal domain-containing protein [Noviherbaspirillum sedimenti]
MKIIGLNDYHGHLESPGSFAENTATPFANRTPVGGADMLAAHVARIKSRNALNVVVGAGDFVGASPLVSGLFHDEPSVETLNRIGLEFVAVGNHEFDKGWRELLRLQKGGCKMQDGVLDAHSCKGTEVGTPVPFEGAKFQWLAANVFNKASGETILPAYAVKHFRDVPIAFVGMTLKGTPAIVSPEGIGELEFRDEAQTINALMPQLRAQGIDAVVVLLHEGGVQSGSLQDINGCEGDLKGSPVAQIVARLDDAVDLVISGHTHAAYRCRLPNAVGRAIPVTSAGAYGRVLTDIDVRIDRKSRDIMHVHAVNRLVARNEAELPADSAVASIVAAYQRLAAPIANRVIGSVAADVTSARVDGACNMTAGSMIADAQIDAAAAQGRADIAFMNGGGVRHPGLVFRQSGSEGDGSVTYAEAFAMQPFGNSLVTMTLTAQGIKEVLEEQFAGCGGQSPSATRILLPSRGFSFTWNGAAACGSRISDARLEVNGKTEILVDPSGRLPQPDASYRVTVNSYLASGGDGFSTFVKGRDRTGGPQDIDALVGYLQKFKLPNSPYKVSKGDGLGQGARIRRIGDSRVCPAGADTNP